MSVIDLSTISKKYLEHCGCTALYDPDDLCNLPAVAYMDGSGFDLLVAPTVVDCMANYYQVSSPLSLSLACDQIQHICDPDVDTKRLLEPENLTFTCRKSGPATLSGRFDGRWYAVTDVLVAKSLRTASIPVRTRFAFRYLACRTVSDSNG